MRIITWIQGVGTHIWVNLLIYSRVISYEQQRDCIFPWNTTDALTDSHFCAHVILPPNHKILYTVMAITHTSLRDVRPLGCSRQLGSACLLTLWQGLETASCSCLIKVNLGHIWGLSTATVSCRVRFLQVLRFLLAATLDHWKGGHNRTSGENSL